MDAMKIWAGSASTTPLLERPAQSRPRWHRHFAAAGLCALLYPYPALNAIGGVLFGIGLVWWSLGRYFDHSLKAWWAG